MKSLSFYSILCLFVISSSCLSAVLVDPTMPKQAKGGSDNVSTGKVTERLKVQSIFNKETGFVAVISGRVVKQGNQVAGYLVTKIDADTVTLMQAEKIKILRLYQHEIKK